MCACFVQNTAQCRVGRGERGRGGGEEGGEGGMEVRGRGGRWGPELEEQRPITAWRMSGPDSWLGLV